MIKTSIFACIFLFQFFNLSFAESIEDLLKNPDEFSGKTVTIEGEVIGEPLKEEPGIWINVSSGEHKIGVFFKDTGLIEQIKHWGGYKYTGDHIRLKGIFRKSCPEHSTMDIHGTEVAVKIPGLPRQEVISHCKVQLAALLFIICLTMSLIYFIKEKYGKRN